jgi:enoyl-CoA hydratase/carnithine racemase
MPDYRHILLERSPVERIARLTLNRPERRSALNDLMQDEQGDAIDLEMYLETAMPMAAAAAAITLTSRDHAEGAAAIREGRTPWYEVR